MSESEETSDKGRDNVGELDEKKLKEYHYNAAWSMDTNIYKNDKEQYEFLKSKYSNNKDLNEHEIEYLLKLIQSKFDKLNVQNRDTQKPQERKDRQCEDCKNLTRASQYCEFCIRNYLQHNFRNWTGNDKIDEAIQDAQKSVMGPDLVIEFIPFERLKNIQKRNEGRFADIFDAVWIDGPFNKWNEKENILERIGNYNVILKRMKNSEQSASRWFNEILSNFKYDKIASSIVKCYGLTKEPNTGDFILVLNVMDFDLREFCKYLEEKNLPISWKDRCQIIYKISVCLHEIHQEGVIHKDLHPGNVLIRENYEIRISDLELMKQCWDAIPENRPDAKTIYKKIYAMQKTLLDNNANDNTDSSMPCISSQNEFSMRKDLSIPPRHLSSGPKNWLEDKFSLDPKNLTDDKRKKFSSGPKNWVPNLYSSANPSEAKNFTNGFEESGYLTTNEEFSNLEASKNDSMYNCVPTCTLYIDRFIATFDALRMIWCNKHLVEQDTLDLEFAKADNMKSSNESSGTQDTDGTL
ncbi:2847_t:CDS:2 [Gigaspora margarita]|uniref:2847_t:CDS:1 n=1 Tax=Gigaspora margarita TaxID=4874 RepID=A0ABM8VVX8_GIGMA|nr:2847_t:CDS:2 [Gigaspora margarita]